MILHPSGWVPGSFPSEINRSHGGGGTYLCPHDPYQYQRGEAGFYHDTQMGGHLGYQTIPTDNEIFSDRAAGGYAYGWIAARDPQGRMMNVPGPWVPPDGRSPGYNAPISFGDAATDLVAEQQAHNRRMFQLSMISTIAVAASALLAIFRTGSLIREDRHRRNAP
jgi:hypothetical protein